MTLPNMSQWTNETVWVHRHTEFSYQPFAVGECTQQGSAGCLREKCGRKCVHKGVRCCVGTIESKEKHLEWSLIKIGNKCHKCIHLCGVFPIPLLFVWLLASHNCLKRMRSVIPVGQQLQLWSNLSQTRNKWASNGCSATRWRRQGRLRICHKGQRETERFGVVPV